MHVSIQINLRQLASPLEITEASQESTSLSTTCTFTKVVLGTDWKASWNIEFGQKSLNYSRDPSSLLHPHTN